MRTPFETVLSTEFPAEVASTVRRLLRGAAAGEATVELADEGVRACLATVGWDRSFEAGAVGFRFNCVLAAVRLLRDRGPWGLERSRWAALPPDEDAVGRKASAAWDDAARRIAADVLSWKAWPPLRVTDLVDAVTALGATASPADAAASGVGAGGRKTRIAPRQRAGAALRYMQGSATIPELAREFGISKQAVSKWPEIREARAHAEDLRRARRGEL